MPIYFLTSLQIYAIVYLDMEDIKRRGTRNPNYEKSNNKLGRIGRAVCAGLAISVSVTGIAKANDVRPEAIMRPVEVTKQAERISPPLRPKHVFLIGDSIIADECHLLNEYNCVAYPGGWVSDPTGNNLFESFIQQANLQPTDTVVISNISAWKPDGITNDIILQRLDDAYNELVADKVNTILLLPPDPKLPLCMAPNFNALSVDEQQIIGNEAHWLDACLTMDLIRKKEDSWNLPKILFTGPFMNDGVHPSAEVNGGQEILAAQIQSKLNPNR
jgi:hypothetical protein